MKVRSPFDRYTLGPQIGGGGSGRVLKATSSEGDDVAIKVVNVSSLSTKKRKRLRNEIAFCTAYRHRGIIRILDVGSYVDESGAEHVFYVMDLYPGTLRKQMQAGIAHDSVIATWLRTVEAVEAAHALGVWHRDIKPENILVDAEGSPVLADFGIARIADANAATTVETAPQERLANYLYRAPEQAGAGTRRDHRVDVFALGLILNEMFTGEVRHGSSPKRIADVAPAHSYLDGLVELMTRTDPDTRLADLAEVRVFIARAENDLSAQKQLAFLHGTVVEQVVLDDPLINDPIRIIDVDYREGHLEIVLSQKPSRLWIEKFRGVDGGMSIQYPPAAFDFQFDRGMIHVPEELAKRVRDTAKQAVRQANDDYAAHRTREVQAAQSAVYERMQAGIREAERRERMRKELNSELHGGNARGKSSQPARAESRLAGRGKRSAYFPPFGPGSGETRRRPILGVAPWRACVAGVTSLQGPGRTSTRSHRSRHQRCHVPSFDADSGTMPSVIPSPARTPSEQGTLT